LTGTLLARPAENDPSQSVTTKWFGRKWTLEQENHGSPMLIRKRLMGGDAKRLLSSIDPFIHLALIEMHNNEGDRQKGID
jgi:hypothetical protein